VIIATVTEREGARTGIYSNYLRALAMVGATSLMIDPASDPETLEPVWDMVDGLLLAGGGDIDPACYGQSPTASLDSVDRQRDAVELAGIRGMQSRGRRVLGICRGAQLLAVAAGGVLTQDLPAAGLPSHRADRVDRAYAEVWHGLKVELHSLVDQVLDGVEEVNSEHHQAIADPGDLTATAWSSDGVIEAVEGDGALGLQWHAEFLIDKDRRHLRPFRWLVDGEKGLTA
jgi:putative glutamine amidotransferase